MSNPSSNDPIKHYPILPGASPDVAKELRDIRTAIYSLLSRVDSIQSGGGKLTAADLDKIRSALQANGTHPITVTNLLGGSPNAATQAASEVVLTWPGDVNANGFSLTGLSSITVGGPATVNGSTTLNGSLNVGGSSTFQNVTVSGTFSIGAISVGSTLDVTGATHLHDILDVTGAATLHSTLIVTGTSTLGTLNAGATTVSSLTVTGAFSPASLSVSGNGSIGGTFDATGAAHMHSSLQVDGATTLAGNVTISTPNNVTIGSGWVNYTPVVTAAGSMTVSGLTIGGAHYLRIGPIVWFELFLTFTLGGTANNRVTVTLPSNVVGFNNVTDVIINFAGGGYNNGFGSTVAGGNTMDMFKTGQSNWSLGSVSVIVQGFYRCV